MINLTADMFVQLALSAKRHKEKEPEIDESKYTFDHVYRPAPVEKSQPIEDTVEEILENPEVVKLKKELDTVEELFYKMKKKGENTDYIMRLESRILRLRKILEDQSVV